MEQWEALGGRKILQVKQYFSLTVTPLTMISLVRGGGLNRGPLPEFGTSEGQSKTDECDIKVYVDIIQTVIFPLYDAYNLINHICNAINIYIFPYLWREMYK